MKGLLLLFEDATAGGLAYARYTENYYNPKITITDVIVEGVPNQIYSQNMRSYHICEKAKKLFSSSPSSKRDPEAAVAEMHLALSCVTFPSFLATKFCVWLDLRTTDDKQLHGNGRRIENGADGLTIQISKTGEIAGILKIYLYATMDAQLNIENGKLAEILY